MLRQENKKASPIGDAFVWQREKDSNPHKQSQSLLCYLYTIPLRNIAYYTAKKEIVNPFFYKNQENVKTSSKTQENKL